MQHDASRTAASATSRLQRPSPGSVYLSEMHLALLGDLDRAVEAAVGLRQDRLAGRAAAATDRAAAAVEEPQHDAVLAGDVAQRALGPVDLPLGRGDAGVLGRVGVAEHDLLHVAAGGDHPAVRRVATAAPPAAGRRPRARRPSRTAGRSRSARRPGCRAARVDQTGLAGQHHDRVQVVDVVGHRDDVGLDGVGTVGVERRPDGVEQRPARPRRSAGRSSRTAADQRAARGHLAGEQGDPRRPVELGVRGVELAEPVVERREGGVVRCAVLAHVEGGEARADRGRRADQPQDGTVGGQPVTAREHRVADQGQVGQQLVETEVVATGLVRGAVGQPVPGALQPDPDEGELEPVGLLGVEPGGRPRR